MSLTADLTGIAEVKHLSKKTNPNIGVAGINEEYMAIKGLNIDKGRNFSSLEVQYGSKSVILGKKVLDAIYESNEDPLGTEISFKGTQFRVIGVL